jgi:hypothetical protein
VLIIRRKDAARQLADHADCASVIPDCAVIAGYCLPQTKAYYRCVRNSLCKGIDEDVGAAIDASSAHGCFQEDPNPPVQRAKQKRAAIIALDFIFVFVWRNFAAVKDGIQLT